ncbi:MAG: hypothetical protein GY749_14600 [Desulfobacteraceae bacterium]|nr:hypothetical protein [Desulfobacteraceae bacterium]
MHIIAVIEILAQIYFISHAIKTDKPRYWIIILLIPWVGFTAYFLTEFLPEILQNQTAGDAIEHTGKSDQPTNHKLAYITQGKLFHKSDSAPLKQIQSHFGQNLVDRAVRTPRSTPVVPVPFLRLVFIYCFEASLLMILNC